MPGVVLSFTCPCGFRKNDVWVGASANGIHSTIFLCRQCGKIVPAERLAQGLYNTNCVTCLMPLTAITAPGAWEPAQLQQRFPGSEPWMVYDAVLDLQEEEMEKLLPLTDRIRILCPKCKNHALTFEETGCWD